MNIAPRDVIFDTLDEEVRDADTGEVLADGHTGYLEQTVQSKNWTVVEWK